MPLSFSTKSEIETRLNDLTARIAGHESGYMPLIPEALADYKNDIGILENLLSGKYEKALKAIDGFVEQNELEIAAQKKEDMKTYMTSEYH